MAKAECCLATIAVGDNSGAHIDATAQSISIIKAPLIGADTAIYQQRGKAYDSWHANRALLAAY